MKGTLDIEGKYYRRENGKLVRYKKGDFIEVTPAEARRLNIREKLEISDKPKKITRKTKPEKKVEVKDKKVEVKADETPEEVKG